MPFGAVATVCFAALRTVGAALLLSGITRSFACSTEMIAAPVSEASWLVEECIPVLLRRKILLQETERTGFFLPSFPASVLFLM